MRAELAAPWNNDRAAEIDVGVPGGVALDLGR